jgi:hypothetical protein
MMMKAITKLILIAFMATALLAGCSKDDDETEPENNNPAGNTLTCTVNGTAWNASLAVVATNTGGVLTVTGSDSNAGQCQVIIFNPSGAGTYPLGGNLTNQSNGRWTQGTGQEDTYTTMLGQGQGTVEITELSDTKVKGTFSFTAKNSAGTEVTITEGSFSSTFSQ